MGEILETMIKALEQRMDSGVLHDLSSTRLHMLIGEEVVRKSRQLPDTSEVIEIIESAMQKYFGMALEAETEEASEPDFSGKTQQVNEPIKFKLNIKKNNENFHTIINKVPVLFSPVILKNYLNNFVKKTLESSSPGLYIETIEKNAFENSYNMLSDILKGLSSAEQNQKIRLGMIIFKLLGFGDSKINKTKNGWEVLLFLKKETHLNFCLGFVKGVFRAAMESSFNKLNFKLNENPSGIIVGLSG